MIKGLSIEARILTSFTAFSLSFGFKVVILTFFKAYSFLSETRRTKLKIGTFVDRAKTAFAQTTEHLEIFQLAHLNLKVIATFKI